MTAASIIRLCLLIGIFFLNILTIFGLKRQRTRLRQNTTPPPLQKSILGFLGCRFASDFTRFILTILNIVNRIDDGKWFQFVISLLLCLSIICVVARESLLPRQYLKNWTGNPKLIRLAHHFALIALFGYIITILIPFLLSISPRYRSHIHAHIYEICSWTIFGSSFLIYCLLGLITKKTIDTLEGRGKRCEHLLFPLCWSYAAAASQAAGFLVGGCESSSTGVSPEAFLLLLLTSQALVRACQEYSSKSATLREENSRHMLNTIVTPAKRPESEDVQRFLEIIIYRLCFVDLEEGSTACPPPSPESQDTEANNKREEAAIEVDSTMDVFIQEDALYKSWIGYSDGDYNLRHSKGTV